MLGSVHEETYAQGKGIHEFDNLNLTDETVLKNLILNRRKLDLYHDLDINGNTSISDDCSIFYENILIMYMDLDDLIKKTRLTKLQRWLVNNLMYGHSFEDIVELNKEKEINIINLYSIFNKAVYNLKCQAEENWKFGLMWDKVKTKTKWKQCSKCKEFKPATEEFYGLHPDTTDGFQSNCKQCNVLMKK